MSVVTAGMAWLGAGKDGQSLSFHSLILLSQQSKRLQDGLAHLCGVLLLTISWSHPFYMVILLFSSTFFIWSPSPADSFRLLCMAAKFLLSKCRRPLKIKVLKSKNVTSTLFYWSKQVTRPAQNQGGSILWEGQQSHVHRRVDTGRNNLLGASFSCLQKGIITNKVLKREEENTIKTNMPILRTQINE